MPSSPNYRRNYTQERKTALKRGEQQDNASRKRASRAHAKKNGKCKGDVDHKDGNPKNNSPSNLRCVSKGKNRSFKRNKNAGKAQNGGAYRVK